MSRRAEILRLQDKLQEKLETRVPERIAFRGLLGDHDGNVVCTEGEDRFVYVRREGRAVISNVLNLRVNNIADMPVLVGYSSEFPNRLQVLSIAGGQLGWNLGSIGFVADHHQQHEFRRSSGGGDVVWVAKQQITEILVYPSTPNAMTVETMKGLYPYEDGWEWWSATTSADLSGHVPGVNLGRFVLVSIDTTVDPHVLQYTDGTTFPKTLFPTSEADIIPDPPAASIPLAAIYLEDTTTEITWGQIYDTRIGIPMGLSGVVSATAHELLDGSVHPDTVDVDPTTGDIIIADGTPEWNVLAIGGAGGILIVNSVANALEYLALGARGGILKVNAAADALEYLGVGAADEVLKSDGNDPAWANVGHDELTDVANDDHHDPVTLHADIDANLLALSTQEVDLDTQAANEVFAGPSSGAAAKPAFRALVADDIPAAITEDSVDAIMTDANASVMVDANGDVMMES